MKKINFLLITLAWNTLLFAQTPPLFTIGSEQVSKTEFERIYKKNNSRESNTDAKSINEYLDLYVNFKLMVKEAKTSGMDTLEGFVRELSGYKKQLSQPYLTDKNVSDGLIKEAFDRMGWEVRCSHILVLVDENALPKDSLIAFRKIDSLRQIVLKGQPFDSVSKAASEDPSAKYNFGDLGYFTVFNLIYSFENYAYKEPVGQVSLPFRTRFGYHIIQVKDRRKARPDVQVAHIMLKPSKLAVSKAMDKVRIDSLYNRLKTGADFAELAKQYSEDEQTAKNGGVLNNLSSIGGPWPVEFKDAAYGLQNPGDYGQPVESSFGWHIIKLIARKPLPTFDQTKDQLKTRISRDQRSEVNRTVMVEKIKKEYGFKEEKIPADAFYKLDSAKLRTELPAGRWTPDSLWKHEKQMFSLGIKKFTQKDFMDYVTNYQSPKQRSLAESILAGMYKDFVNFQCMSYEESKLESKYEDFRNLLQEYHDGILLFDLKDKRVWSKSVSDSSGLQSFYEMNKSAYMWKDRVDATIYECNDAKVAKQVKKLLKKGIAQDSILKKLNAPNPLNLTAKTAKYEKGENTWLDSVSWTNGIRLFNETTGRVKLLQVRESLPIQPKKLNEAKGIITSDYQQYLEKEWVNELRQKYPVKVDEAVKANLFK